MSKAAYLLFFILAFTASSAARATILISESVGQAGSHTVTSREVQLAFVVDWAMAHHKSAPPTILYNSKTFANELVAVLKDWVVYMEIKGFAGNDPSPDEISQLTTATKQFIKNSSFYSSLEFSNDEISSTIVRNLKVAKFIQFKRLAAAAPISDEKVKAYFEKNRQKFGKDATFNEYKDSIRHALSQKLVNERLQDWFIILIRKYQAHSFLQDF